MTPSFTSRVDGNNITVTLKMNGKIQEFTRAVWSTKDGVHYGPSCVSKEALQMAKALVDNNIASMSPKEFAAWLMDATLYVNM